MPFWAAKTRSLVYLTDRNGPFEIWIRKGSEDRPAVTLHDFPADSTQWFMGPALSPDGDRIIYTRIEPGGLARLWISSVAGGAPLPLTNHIGTSEFPGAWSPDGNWYAYLQIYQGQVDLLKVKTTGQGTPVVLKKNIQDNGGLPAWSPNGDWIHVSDNGELLISPDGKTGKEARRFPGRRERDVFGRQQTALWDPPGSRSRGSVLRRHRDRHKTRHRRDPTRDVAQHKSKPRHAAQPFTGWKERIL